MSGTLLRFTVAMAACVAAFSLCAFAARPPDPIDVRLLISQSAVRPGDAFQVAVEITTKGEFHVYGPAVAGNGLMPLSIAFAKVEGLTFGEARFPPTRKLHVKPLGKAFDVYEGKIVVLVPATAGKNVRPGRVTIRGRVRYQACTAETCLMPAREAFSLPVPVVAKGTEVQALHPKVFASMKAEPTREAMAVLHVDGMT